MSPLMILVLLGAHLLLGLGIGLYVRFTPGHRAAGGPSPREVCRVVIDDLERDTAHHGLELSGFRSELESGEFAESVSAGSRVTYLAESSRFFEQRMQSGNERLSTAVGRDTETICTQVASRVGEYCGRLDTFRSALTHCLDGHSPNEAAASLMGVVTELTAFNLKLSADLRQAGNELAGGTAAKAAPRPAPIDPLTGLPNQIGFQEHHAGLHANLQTCDEGYALVFYAVDHFAALSEQHGTEAADSVLRRFARRLANTVRVYDHAARIGDSTFAVLLPRAGVYEAETSAERVRAQVMQTVVRGQGAIGYTVTAGVTAAFRGEPARAVIARAETALRAAQTQGGNCVIAEFGLDQAAPAGSVAT